MLAEYVAALTEVAKAGDAREESYYGALKTLFDRYAEKNGHTRSHVTVLPKQTEAGNPDFRIWDGNQRITGYIEAKAPHVRNLDSIEQSDQLKRYLSTFPNVILTNFYEFRFYRNGTFVDMVQIARPVISEQLQQVPPVENAEKWHSLMEQFYAFSLPRFHSARSLAEELAKRTRFLRDAVIREEIEEEAASEPGFMLGFYEAFTTYLIHGLTHEEFADLYAQTIAYGLFAARTRSDEEFNRRLAYEHIPHTIGILRDVFRYISIEDIPPQMEWIVDDISEVLAVTDVRNILQEYFHEGRGKDPVVHFYETFLAEYDPRTRERRGVYYTPEPVVSYIVRSVHQILQDRFGKTDGLADQEVTVLDPAGGTLTFLAEAAKLAVDEFKEKYGDGGKGSFIKEHILEHFYAFELMMAPYAIGHLKMSFLLEELGYQLTGDDRFKLYLTNTLEMDDLAQTSIPGMGSLSEESRLANQVKKDEPILAIMGNPPYSYLSTNTGEWISEILEEYYQLGGKSLNEKNPRGLQDDYVKFIRFAQWKIEQRSEGIIAFITNHNYIDGPTFRGMRESLMQSFDKMYILDLHGNSLRKEITPEGDRDLNVFDIMQGVAISIFVKDNSTPSVPAIYHSEIWGERESKYQWLEANDITTTEWAQIEPVAPQYTFKPQDSSIRELFRSFLPLDSLFKFQKVGMLTGRDRFTIKWSEEKVWNTITQFNYLDTEIARQGFNLGKDSQDWKVKNAKEDIADSGPSKEHIIPILYRPFDVRYTYFTGRSRGFHMRPRGDIMQHFVRENLALIIPKRVETNIPWQHVLVTDKMAEHVAVSLKTSDYVFPLKLYPAEESNSFFSEPKTIKPNSNIKKEVILKLASVYNNAVTPEVVFRYIYGLLYMESYRIKYADFLKLEFPRIPFTVNYQLFQEVANHGGELIKLHTLESSSLDSPITRFQGEGNGRVENRDYDPAQETVTINESQYFEGVPSDVWEYQVGGYQVCDKWLKDRKGRSLTADEIRMYCRIVTALAKTIEIQEEIDTLYPAVEEEVIEFG